MEKSILRSNINSIFLVNTYQTLHQINPKENLTKNEYQIDWQGDLGSKDSFLELSSGSRIEKSRSKQSF